MTKVSGFIGVINRYRSMSMITARELGTRAVGSENNYYLRLRSPQSFRISELKKISEILNLNKKETRQLIEMIWKGDE